MFDDLIETIEDTFDGLSDGVKKLDKKKVFIAAGVIVGGAALIVWYRNRNTGSTEYVETVIAGNGAGDISSTGSLTDSGTNELVDEFNDVLAGLQDDFNAELSARDEIYKDQLSGVRSEFDSKLKETETYYTDQLVIMNGQVQELTAENETLSRSIGSYDNSINYTQEIKDVMADGAAGNSDKVSTLVIARATKIANEESKSQYRTDYDKNVDYSAAINKAKSEGASQEVIDTLTAQREAKIKGEQLTQYYGDLKKE